MLKAGWILKSILCLCQQVRITWKVRYPRVLVTLGRFPGTFSTMFPYNPVHTKSTITTYETFILKVVSGSCEACCCWLVAVCWARCCRDCVCLYECVSQSLCSISLMSSLDLMKEQCFTSGTRSSASLTRRFIKKRRVAPGTQQDADSDRQLCRWTKLHREFWHCPVVIQMLPEIGFVSVVESGWFSHTSSSLWLHSHDGNHCVVIFKSTFSQFYLSAKSQHTLSQGTLHSWVKTLYIIKL